MMVITVSSCLNCSGEVLIQCYGHCDSFLFVLQFVCIVLNKDMSLIYFFPPHLYQEGRTK